MRCSAVNEVKDWLNDIQLLWDLNTHYIYAIGLAPNVSKESVTIDTQWIADSG